MYSRPIAGIEAESLDGAESGAFGMSFISGGRGGGQARVVGGPELLDDGVSARRITQDVEDVLFGAAAIQVGVDRQARGRRRCRLDREQRARDDRSSSVVISQMPGTGGRRCRSYAVHPWTA